MVLGVECDENENRQGQKLRHKATVRQGAGRKRDSTPYKSAGVVVGPQWITNLVNLLLVAERPACLKWPSPT